MTTHTGLTKSALATGGALALIGTSVLGGTAALAQSAEAGSQGNPAPQAAAKAPQLPTIKDTWSKSWKEEDRLKVSHPKYGGLEIRTYFKQTSAPGAAPEGGYVGYAVYQNERPVGFAQGSDPDAVMLTTSPVYPQPRATMAHQQDAYGNVFLFSGTDVVLLHPTDSGYDSLSTLPGERDPILRDATSITVPENGGALIKTQHGPTMKTVPSKPGTTGLVAA